MRRIISYFVSILFSATLIGPMAAQTSALFASVRPTGSSLDDKHERRYYDKRHKDYHEWTEAEDRAYRHWLKEQQKEYRDFAKLRRREQRDYWEWRHEHPEELR